MNKNRLHFGIPTFSATLDLGGGDGKPMLSLGCASRHERGFKTIVRDAPLVGGVDGALETLAASFELLCGPIAGRSEATADLDLGELAGRPGEAYLRRRGMEISAEAAGSEVARFGSESVIVLEVLAGLGEALAEAVGDDALRVSWKAALGRCEVLPFMAEDEPLCLSRETLDRETAWYAGRVGQDVESYRLTAVWLMARQYLYAAGVLSSEPLSEEWRVDAVHELPPAAVIWNMARQASGAVEADFDEMVESALVSRNSEARAVVVFERWYGKSRTGFTC